MIKDLNTSYPEIPFLRTRLLEIFIALCKELS